MPITKITETFKDKRFVRHEFSTMNVYCDKMCKNLKKFKIKVFPFNLKYI